MPCRPSVNLEVLDDDVQYPSDWRKIVSDFLPLFQDEYIDYHNSQLRVRTTTNHVTLKWSTDYRIYMAMKIVLRTNRVLGKFMGCSYFIVWSWLVRKNKQTSNIILELLIHNYDTLWGMDNDCPNENYIIMI